MLLLICNRELMFILSEKHRQDNAPQGCTTILIGIMSTELTRIVCQILAEQDLIIRESDEDDMARSTKTYEERIRALEKLRNRKASKLPKSSLHSERNWKRERKPRKVENEPTGSVRLAVRWNRFLAVRLRRRDLTKVDRLLKKAGNKRDKFSLKGDAERATYRYGGSVMAEGSGFSIPFIAFE